MAISFKPDQMFLLRQLFRDYNVYVEETYLPRLGRSHYQAMFKSNGVKFESDTPLGMANQVRTYAEATKNLTGVYP